MIEHPHSAKAFDFIDGFPDRRASPHCFVLHVRAGIPSKAELLRALANAGQFPGYFGENWDALLDCLLDFGWVREKQIVIAHSDLPLLHHPADCRLYLEILREARLSWSKAGERSYRSIGEGLVDHELVVRFPRADQASVKQLLGSQPGA